jgi:AAA domain
MGAGLDLRPTLPPDLPIPRARPGCDCVLLERGVPVSDCAEQIAAPPGSPLSEWKRKWPIYTPGELKQRCKELVSDSSVIGGLIPKRSLRVVAGDSGIGKSPLLYQAAICVASGVPFLGRPVSRGRVLYLDLENGLGDVDELVTRLSRAPQADRNT